MSIRIGTESYHTLWEKKFPANQGGMKLDSTHLFLVYADHVKLSGNSIHTIKKNTESLFVTSDETALESQEVLKLLSTYSSFANRYTFIRTLVKICIKIRWLLHGLVYYHHQGACN